MSSPAKKHRQEEGVRLINNGPTPVYRAGTVKNVVEESDVLISCQTSDILPVMDCIPQYGNEILVEGAASLVSEEEDQEIRSIPWVNKNAHIPNSKVPGSMKEAPTISVLFVDQTVGGELARRLQQVEDRLAGVTGYRVRISETSGSQLCRLLPSTNPWGYRDCSRQDCYTCGQEGEDKVDCKERNVIYESACVLCNGDKFDKKSKWESFK
jgi:hypothetical protein